MLSLRCFPAVLITTVICQCFEVDAQKLSFVVLADWGGLPKFPFRTPIEEAVAARLADVGGRINASFVLALGDNFYYDGVTDVDDPRFQETYNQVFLSSSLDINWYLVAGNHDHNGNITAQIAYSKLVKRWNYPALYYKLSFSIPGTTRHIDILMTDSIVLCGNTRSDFLYEQPPGPRSINEAEKQWTWLEENLATSKADYLIVTGHYPVYSIAEHGPTFCLLDRMMPLLHKYKVTAYLSGHDHNLQHLATTAFNATVDYFISGAADFIDASKKHKADVPKGSSKFHWADIFTFGGLGCIEVNDEELVFTFVEASGKQLYRHSTKRRSQS
ncbi:hypothetical protein LSH36_296g04043 [Paralvinella palmiformis]|uniref:Tartrate-resistant acid phosphatase type 5 n=1 Tax=Paralvinella palmiformis TaxID=53620 RepID=A0AAD9JIS2_9ANNE|nr:hypothetical protein LSH36_296g04043 [Paralvinella palmiformis]